MHDDGFELLVHLGRDKLCEEGRKDDVGVVPEGARAKIGPR